MAHSARVHDYWLGGKDNFAADRELGQRTLEAYPNLVYSVRANRAFLARAVRFLAEEAGIRLRTGGPSPLRHVGRRSPQTPDWCVPRTGATAEGVE